MNKIYMIKLSYYWLLDYYILTPLTKLRHITIGVQNAKGLDTDSSQNHTHIYFYFGYKYK
jgi:hypothetical protein